MRLPDFCSRSESSLADATLPKGGALLVW